MARPLCPHCRSKLYKLQHGTELPFEMKAPGSEPENSSEFEAIALFPLPAAAVEEFLFPSASSTDASLDLTMIANQKEESRKILRE